MMFFYQNINNISLSLSNKRTETETETEYTTKHQTQANGSTRTINRSTRLDWIDLTQPDSSAFETIATTSVSSISIDAVSISSSRSTSTSTFILL